MIIAWGSFYNWWWWLVLTFIFHMYNKNCYEYAYENEVLMFFLNKYRKCPYVGKYKKWETIFTKCVAITIFHATLQTNRLWCISRMFTKWSCYLNLKYLYHYQRISFQFCKHLFEQLTCSTGWPKSKFTFSISSVSERRHSWPQVGKAKMCLRGGGFLWELADFHM